VPQEARPASAKQPTTHGQILRGGGASVMAAV